MGFAVYNKRPASIFMGDAGSLFLGFALAVVAMDVSPALTPPTSFVVPVMLLALPVLDTATVTICPAAAPALGRTWAARTTSPTGSSPSG